jgi:CelD/BcsL family acetyltransferase involved in cellulose biosynthesis
VSARQTPQKRANVAQRAELTLEAWQPTPEKTVMQPAVAAAVNISLNTGLASLEREWREFESNAACTPFQTYDWLSTWQRCVGANAGVTPAIITARQHGKLLFILPLAAHQKRLVRQVTFLGHTLCDYNAPLLAPDFSAQVSDTQFKSLWEAARALLQGQFQYDVLLLDKMPEKIGQQANPMRLFGTSLHPSGAHAMALGENWERFYSAKRSSATRRRDRTKRRKLAEFGDLRFITAETADEIRKTMDILIEQKSRWFQRMGIPNLFEIPAQKEFFLSLAMTVRPFVHVSRLSVGANCAAANLGLLFQGCYYHVLTSYDDGPMLRFGPGVAHLHDLMRFAVEHGCKSFDFTIGDEAYKQDWADSQLELHDHVSGDGFLGRLAAAAIKAKLRVKRYIKNSPLVWGAVLKLRFMLGRRGFSSR